MAVALINYIHYDPVARRVGLVAGARLVTRTTLATARLADRTVPVRTGTLRSAQRHRVRQVGLTTRGRIWYDTKYAASVHEGAKPHVIRPRRPGGKLVFMYKGRLVVTDRVNHPGNRPDPWLYAALYIRAARQGFRVTPR